MTLEWSETKTSPKFLLTLSKLKASKSNCLSLELLVITGFVLVQSPPQDPKSCVTMEESASVI
jgi:hypothetical protein